MSERKPRLEWRAEPIGERAKVGEHFSAEVWPRAGGWRWDVRAAHVVIAWNATRATAAPTKLDAQLAAEDALREVLTEALRALDRGDP